MGGGHSKLLKSKTCKNNYICYNSDVRYHNYSGGFMKKFFAFTLAEVLITIGVIGVVAAITLPSIVSNIQGMQYRSKVKKTYSALVQAVSLAKANYDVDLDTLETSCVDGENDKLPSTYSVCALFNSTLSGAKYISETDPNHPKYYHDEIKYAHAYQLSDGSTVSFILNSEYISYPPSEIYGYIDVNGKTGPNKITKATDPKVVTVTESYSLASFKANAYNGKPDQFYDTYFYRIPMRQYDYYGSRDHGALRYVMTH